MQKGQKDVPQSPLTASRDRRRTWQNYFFSIRNYRSAVRTDFHHQCAGL